MGNLLLPKLQPIQIQSYLTKALESGRSNGKGGLSEKTVLNHFRVLKEALHHAVGWQLLSYNPAEAVKPPRPKHKEIEVLPDEEFFIFLEAAREHRYHMPFLLASTTGMRRGEVLGVRWQDINFTERKLAVRQAVGITNNGLIIKSPKTKKSKRVISLSASSLEALCDHRKRQAAEKIALGEAYNDFGLVCAHPDGSMIHPRSLSESFTNLIKKLELTRVSFHALRHTHATQCLARGLHIKVVSERLGHSSVQITLDTYSHVMPDLQEEAALNLESFYENGRERRKQAVGSDTADNLVGLDRG